MEFSRAREIMCGFVGAFLQKKEISFLPEHDYKKNQMTYRLPYGGLRIIINSPNPEYFCVQIEFKPKNDVQKEITKRFKEKYTEYGFLTRRIDAQTKKFKYDEWIDKIMELIEKYNYQLIGYSGKKEKEIEKTINEYVDTLEI